MKNTTYTHDYRPLEAVLCNQYEPELLSRHLDESLRAIVFHALKTGMSAEEAMNTFEAVLSLKSAVGQMIAPNYQILNLPENGDSSNQEAA